MAEPTSEDIPRPARKRRSRAERARENREALLNSAADIIGESGYEGATIAQVTRRAGLSLGSFYQYFESREDLFRQLLPAIGARLIEALAQETQDAGSAQEEEERSIEAYFDYVQSGNPIMRVFTEAQIYAPEAYADHMNNVLTRYTKALARQQANGEYSAFEAGELRAVAVLLTAARVEFYRYFTETEQDTELVKQVFVKIIKALSEAKS